MGQCNWSRRKENGKCIRVFGTFQDISKQKQTEEELEKANLFHLSILDSLSEHIAVIDSNGMIVAVNESWKNLHLKMEVVKKTL